jgi:four helix bundle protein
MSTLPFAKDYRDLVVYQKTIGIEGAIFEISKSFPRDERFSLTDQIRRSSRSIGAQIAEAWAKRRYVNHFVSKLTDADAERQETQHWVECAFRCSYITEDVGDSVLSGLGEVGKMLNQMIANADRFCSDNTRTVREDVAEYVTRAE